MEKTYLTNVPEFEFHQLSQTEHVQSAQQLGIDHVLIFETNIQTQADKLHLKLILDKHAQIEQWNVDMEDIDCVLRIVSPYLKHGDVIAIVAQCGFYCRELL